MRCATAGHEDVEVLAFDSKRYVGAQIGIHGPTGEKVGQVKRLRNVEYLFVAGERDRVQAAAGRRLRARRATGAGLTPASDVSYFRTGPPTATDDGCM